MSKPNGRRPAKRRSLDYLCLTVEKIVMVALMGDSGLAAAAADGIESGRGVRAG